MNNQVICIKRADVHNPWWQAASTVEWQWVWFLGMGSQNIRATATRWWPCPSQSLFSRRKDSWQLDYLYARCKLANKTANNRQFGVLKIQCRDFISENRGQVLA